MLSGGKVLGFEETKAGGKYYYACIILFLVFAGDQHRRKMMSDHSFFDDFVFRDSWDRFLKGALVRER